ncbi:MAG: hypothetical protein IPJ27_23260 [Candidatus Accumulibacter sp.]|uniref:Uncharacterized protein n=1 Tax=Candidatus Accumulibacter proximus TaxID=2954385 RepID=A0A935Q1W4_9PROT|nr:hypothetical protein [Candidatus Accumulibacter proximus]
MARIAGIAGDELPEIYVVDADVDPEPQDNESSLHGKIVEVYKDLTSGIHEDSRPKLVQIRPQLGNEYRGGQSFGALIAKGCTNSETKQALEALFSREELDLQINAGMFARPNVGATAIWDRILTHDSGLAKARELISLGDHVADADRVVIVGSNFGGTGSGGVPAFTHWVYSKVRLRRDARVRAVVVLPWFELAANSAGGASGVRADKATVKANAAAGLRAYGELFKFIDEDADGLAAASALYAGLPQAEPRPDKGNTHQPEHKHVFNLLLASLVQRFLMEGSEPEKGHFGIVVSSFGENKHLGISSAPAGEQQPNSLITFHSPDGVGNYSLKEWVTALQALRLLADEVKSWLDRGYSPRGWALAPVPPYVITTTARWICAKEPIEAGRRLPGAVLTSIAMAVKTRLGHVAEDLEWLHSVKAGSTKVDFDFDERCLAPSPRDNAPFFIGATRNLDSFLYQNMCDALTPLDGDEIRKRNVSTTMSAKVEGGNTDPYRAAADIITRWLYAHVVANQPTWISTAGNRKAEEAPGNNGGTKVFLLPEGVRVAPTQAASDYIQRLDVSTLTRGQGAAAGSADGAAAALDAAHPFSLSAYSNRHHGIPSPWAPAHLCAWRQLAPDVGNPEGIACSADRRLESILWGIFRKTLSVKSFTFSMIDGDSPGLARVLEETLQRETWPRAANDLGSRKFTVALLGERVIAANHPECLWFEAPDQLRGDWWTHSTPNPELEGFWLPSERDFAAQTSACEIGYSGALAFVAYLADELRDAGTTPVAWQSCVSRIVDRVNANLRRYIGRWPNANAAPLLPLSATPDCYYKMLGNGLVVTRPIKRLEKTREELLRDCCPSTLVAWCDLGRAALKLPDWPVLASKVKQVEACDRLQSNVVKGDDLVAEVRRWRAGATQQMMKNGVNLQNGMSSWRIRFYRYGETYAEFPYRVVQESYLAVAVWPGRLISGWNFYYLGAAFEVPPSPDRYFQTSAEKIRGATRLAVLDCNGEVLCEDLGVQTNASPSVRAELHGVPNWLEVSVRVEAEREGESKLISGLVRINLDGVGVPLKRAGVEADLAFDFGTSHSAFFAGLVDNQGAVGKQLVLSFDFPSAFVLDLGGDSKAGVKTLLLEYGEFLPAAAATVANTTNLGPILPTELYWLESFESSVSTVPPTVKETVSVPMRFLSDASNHPLVSDFKQHGRCVKTNGDRKPLGDIRSFQFAEEYIRQFLAMALSVLSDSANVTSIRRVRCTYPLAWPKAKQENYENLIDRIIFDNENGLRYLTGIEFAGRNDGQTWLLSESEAAVAALPVAHRAGPVAVLDLGGGTLDIAILPRLRDAQTSAHQWAVGRVWDGSRDQGPVLFESICYGGHDLLDMLVPHIRPGAGSAEMWSLSRIKAGLRFPASFEQIAQSLRTSDVAKNTVRLFFMGLQEFAKRLLAPYAELIGEDAEGSAIDVILIGNGWNLWKLVADEDDRLEDSFKRHLDLQGNGNLPISVVWAQPGGAQQGRGSFDAKCQLVKGAYLAAQAAQRPTHNHWLAGFSLKYLHTATDGQQTEKTLAQSEWVKRATAGNDRVIKIMDLGLPLEMHEKLEAWCRTTTGISDASATTLVERAISNRRTMQDSPIIRWSPFAVFLEDVWLKYVQSLK